MSDASRRRQEMIIMDDRPHIDGITRGTVVEYDDWQWGVVTEIAEEMEPTKVGFVLVDGLRDAIVRDLEEAIGCWEHYEAVMAFCDTEHEYWTSAEYIQDDDMWTVLGPIHPDARDDDKELVTDGGQQETVILQYEDSVTGEDTRIVAKPYDGDYEEAIGEWEVRYQKRSDGAKQWVQFASDYATEKPEVRT